MKRIYCLFEDREDYTPLRGSGPPEALDAKDAFFMVRGIFRSYLFCMSEIMAMILGAIRSQGGPLGSVRGLKLPSLPEANKPNSPNHKTLDEMDSTKILSKSSAPFGTTTKELNSSKASTFFTPTGKNNSDTPRYL
ncbi:hypothetical protein DSO57_1020539 [Entomophthora muscae]|uniref:Uncharacterized protein n=1 Tax=Entomophthora muscae TaxID=34485 RepID=A0ACC2RUT9_9FUNG|nr:hypothetical protein DSO57_1020539 [Entomophthora muscae]